jgi:multiple sugar transport system substrate-binding protein
MRKEAKMSGFTRRRFLTGATAATAAGAAHQLLKALPAQAATLSYKPEPGATLRVLRWKRFVQGDEDQFMANTRRFTQLTGVEVRVDSENFEDLRPKAAVAANVGAGPDIVISTDEQPQLYPDKLLDVSELAQYLGQKYGGWFEVCPEYCMHQGKWIAIPTGAAGGMMVYRKSMLQAAGFNAFPKDMNGFLKLCQALKAKAQPPGFALGHATGDANGWTHWVLWAFGGRLTDENSQLALNSKETVAALEYAKALYQTFVPGTLSWLDPSNNKAFLAGEIGLTMNGISIYYAAKTSTDPKLKAMTQDIQHAPYPIGPVGREVHYAIMFPAAIYQYCKYPNAAKEYLRFMMEREQYEPWQRASIGYIAHTLRAYDSNPVWSEDPQHMFFRDVVRGARHTGYAGRLGKESAAVLADYIIVDMFGEVCTGQQTAQDAVRRAERRARRHYRT